MADNRIDISFQVDSSELAEINKAISILDKFNKQSSQVVGALGTMGGAMSKSAQSAKTQSSEFVNLDRVMNAWSSRLKANQSTMSSYEAAQAKLTQKLSEYGRDVKVSVSENGKLTASFKNAEGNLISMSGKYDALNNKVSEMKTTLSTAALEVKKKAEADKAAIQQMDHFHSAAIKMNSELDKQKKAYQELTRGTDLSRVLKMNGNAFDVLNNAVRTNSEVVRGSMDRNGKWTQTLRDQDGTLRSVSGYYDRMNQKLIQYSESVSKAQSGSQKFSSTLTGMRGDVTNLERSMQGLNKYTLSWADALEIAGLRMIQWNLAATAIFGVQRAFRSLFDTILVLDEQITQLNRVMDADTNFNEMMEDSIRLSTELGRTLTDINEAMITFARSGFDNVDTRFLSEAATLMANVSDIDVGDAAETLTSALTLFNVKASDSVQVVNKLNEVNISASRYSNVA